MGDLGTQIRVDSKDHSNNSTEARDTARPHLKGSFSSKFSNPNAKAGAYTVENIQIIDRTANSVFHLLGWDFEINLHKHKDLLVSSHVAAGAYNFLYEEQSLYSSLGSLFYAANSQTDFFSSIDSTPIKCTIEGGYALLRGFPYIPSLIDPSADLLGALINFSLCVNREENYGPSRVPIDSTLNLIKAMLQAKNHVLLAMVKMENPLHILDEMYKTGNVLADTKELWEQKNPDLVVKILAYAKAAWISYDMHTRPHDSEEQNEFIAIDHQEEKTPAVGIINHSEIHPTE